MLKSLFQVSTFFLLPIVKFYWFIFRPKTTGVKSVLLYRDQVLLIKNSYGRKLWTLPGGGIRRGESLEEAVIRETLEEVGIVIQAPKICGSVFYDGEYKKNTIWVFVTNVESPEFSVSSLEVDEVRWFNVNKLPENKSHLLTRFLALTSKQS